MGYTYVIHITTPVPVLLLTGSLFCMECRDQGVRTGPKTCEQLSFSGSVCLLVCLPACLFCLPVLPTYIYIREKRVRKA